MLVLNASYIVTSGYSCCSIKLILSLQYAVLFGIIWGYFKLKASGH